MTVGELIDELKKMPAHHPVRLDYSHAIVGLRQGGSLPMGPVVLIQTQQDDVRQGE
jgi:hypothetical protein